MTDLSEIHAALDRQEAGIEDFKKRHLSRVDEIDAVVKQLALKAGRPDLSTGGNGSTKTLPTFFDTKSKELIRVFGRDDSIAAHEQKQGDLPSIGRVLRGLVLGSKAHDAKQLEEERKALSIGTDPSGGYTVGGVLSSQWIDLMRSEMVLNAAGVTTVPMESKTLTLAKLTGDPTVTWHGENANVPDADVTLGAVTLSAKTGVCLVKLSLELSQDSANIEQILQSSITSAMAHAVDGVGLVGATTNAAAAPGYGIFDLTGRNTVTGVGAPTNWDWAVDSVYELLADNVPMDSIGAMIAHPALWKKMRKLKTGITSDNTPLTMPEEIARMRKLWTTAAPLAGGTTAKAVMGRWSDLLFGIRKDITLQVLNQAFMGSNLQLAVLAYVRCDFAATRAASFVTAEGITV